MEENNKKNKIVIATIIIALVVILSLIGLAIYNGNINYVFNKNAESTNKNHEVKNEEPRIKVVATFNAMEEFAKAIGKDRVEITTIIPDGVEPHDFELKASDLNKLNDAKMLVYNGAGMEEWLEKALENNQNKELKIVEAAKNVDKLKIEDTEKEELIEDKKHEENEDEHHDKNEKHEEEKEHKDKHDHEHEGYDPHIWLSLKNAKKIANEIKEGLIEIDANHKEEYTKNYEEFVSKIEDLEKKYVEKIKEKQNKVILTGHEAFGYLAKELGIKQKGVENVFAEGKPTAKNMGILIEYAKKNNVKTIFAEETENKDVVETISKESGAKLDKLYTIESKEDNKTYLERMEINLQKLLNNI